MMLGACSNEYFIQTEGNMPTKDDIMQVKRGMPQSEVRKIMGSPSVISSLDHRTWIYMNSTMERMAFLNRKNWTAMSSPLNSITTARWRKSYS